jgi:hypothetical protein
MQRELIAKIIPKKKNCYLVKKKNGQFLFPIKNVNYEGRNIMKKEATEKQKEIKKKNFPRASTRLTPF